MDRILVTLLCLGFAACTSVRVETEDVPEETLDRVRFSPASSRDLVSLTPTTGGRLTPGSLWVILKSEDRRERPLIRIEEDEDRVTVRQRFELGKVEFEKGINSIPLFQGKKVSIGWEPLWDLQKLDPLLRKAREQKFDYVLFVSCREHQTAPLSIFYQFLRYSLLYTYDIFPFFKYNLGSFQGEYTSLWEGALLNVVSGRAVRHVTAFTTVKAYDRGDDILLNGDDTYKYTGTQKASVLFAKELGRVVTDSTGP